MIDRATKPGELSKAVQNCPSFHTGFTRDSHVRESPKTTWSPGGFFCLQLATWWTWPSLLQLHQNASPIDHLPSLGKPHSAASTGLVVVAGGCIIGTSTYIDRRRGGERDFRGMTFDRSASALGASLGRHGRALARGRSALSGRLGDGEGAVVPGRHGDGEPGARGRAGVVVAGIPRGVNPYGGQSLEIDKAGCPRGDSLVYFSLTPSRRARRG